jgi:hypothetical protein
VPEQPREGAIGGQRPGDDEVGERDHRVRRQARRVDGAELSGRHPREREDRAGREQLQRGADEQVVGEGRVLGRDLSARLDDGGGEQHEQPSRRAGGPPAREEEDGDAAEPDADAGERPHPTRALHRLPVARGAREDTGPRG